MKHKINKETERRIQEAAWNMPIFREVIYVEQTLTGSQLLVNNPDVKTRDGKEIVRGMKYNCTNPVIKKINHFELMKQAYIKNGTDGVTHYITVLTKVNNRIITPEIKKTLFKL
jgi:hypothetical protein